MSNAGEPRRDRDATRRRAQNHFQQAEARDVMVKQEQNKPRAAQEAKTAKLRALRLAKEAEERAAPPVVKPPKKAAKAKAKAATK